MNRLKLWLFALLVLGAAALALHVTTLAQREVHLRALDGRLQSAAARLDGAARVLARDAVAVALAASKDARLGELLHPREVAAPVAPPRGRKAPPPPPARDPAAEQAAIEAATTAARATAEQQLGLSLPAGTAFRAASRESLDANAGAAAPGDAEVTKLLAAAVDGALARGWVRWSGKLWYGAAAPVGTDAGLVVLVPVEPKWLEEGLLGAGVDATLVVPEVTAPPSTLKAGAQPLVTAALQKRGSIRDAGALAPTTVRVLTLKIPGARLLFSHAPAHRVLAAPVDGLAGGAAVFSAPVLPALAPVIEFQWTGLAGLAVLVVLALLFGLLVKPSEIAAAVPGDLLAAAAKVERGDFSARAPVMAGQLGTVSAALNRAAEAAEAFARRGPDGAAQSLTQEFFAKPAPPPPEPDPSAFDFPPRSAARPPEPPPPPAPEESAALGGGAFEAAPVPAARPAAAPAAIVTPLATPAETLQSAARGAPAADAAGDEGQHWREVFRDFLRIRQECGEPAEGLTFDRFRQKLESNKTALVTKYGCRTVRFQVYVKEGKAALKATPVK